MYKSRDHASWPLSMAEGVSKAIVCLEYTTSTNNYLGSCLSSPKDYTKELPLKEINAIGVQRMTRDLCGVHEFSHNCGAWNVASTNA